VWLVLLGVLGVGGVVVAPGGGGCRKAGRLIVASGGVHLQHSGMESVSLHWSQRVGGWGNV
jgi:hypothetical protein